MDTLEEDQKTSILLSQGGRGLESDPTPTLLVIGSTME